jgi:hypothetical protein
LSFVGLVLIHGTVVALGLAARDLELPLRTELARIRASVLTLERKPAGGTLRAARGQSHVVGVRPRGLKRKLKLDQRTQVRYMDEYLLIEQF